MKKLAVYFFAGILLFTVSCQSGGSKSDADSSANPKTLTATVDTLPGKGITETEARQMIADFDASPQYYKKRTTGWFSKKFIDSLYSVLHNAVYKLDGIRIYLALNQKKEHVFLVVPTQENGTYTLKQCNGRDSTFANHQDFFKAFIAAKKFPVYQGRYEASSNRGVKETSGCPAGLFDPKVFVGGKDHQVPCKEAIKWVKDTAVRRIPENKIVTYSEWFETSFIDSLRSKLSANSERDGVRIYLAAKPGRDCDGHRVHVFIITTTKKIDKDNHGTDFLLTVDPTADDNGEQCLNNCEGVMMLGPNASAKAKAKLVKVLQKNTLK